ncbi:MAG TPA: hypothetical protein VFL46_09925 [Phycicoccus sp.]|nr:hypothetical protein [Phycicoccus sp.]
MTAHTPTHPIGSMRPQHAGRRAVLLVLAVVLATLMATIAVASAVSAVRGAPGVVPADGPRPAPAATLDDNLRPGRGWIVPRGEAPSTKPLPWPHGQYSGT